MTDIEDGSDLLPELPQPTVKETLGKMARVVAFADEYSPGAVDPETAESFPPAATLRQPVSISAAFDAGAGAPSIPTPRKTSTRKAVGRGRPAGAEELQSLFAAGFIMVVAFTVGDWAQPTPEEAKELAAPLGNILARRIDIAAKLGADSNDVIAFTVAMMAYMVRVGPVAAGKVKEALDEREQRTRVDRVRPAPGPRDNRGAGRVGARQDDAASASNGQTHSPFDALASARASSIGSLDRDFGYISGPGSAVGDRE